MPRELRFVIFEFPLGCLELRLCIRNSFRFRGICAGGISEDSVLNERDAQIPKLAVDPAANGFRQVFLELVN